MVAMVPPAKSLNVTKQRNVNVVWGELAVHVLATVPHIADLATCFGTRVTSTVGDLLSRCSRIVATLTSQSIADGSWCEVGNHLEIHMFTKAAVQFLACALAPYVSFL
eukprot:1945527-Amphidinium_carterae.2